MFRAVKLFTLTLLMLTLTLTLAGGAWAGKYAGKKVLFIDSYHQGYAWSDGLTKSVQQALEGTGVELKVIRMDTKRNKDEAFKRQAAQKAIGVIDSFKPDVVIAADDNASKYLIQPNYKDAALPFVFCGVNWDASGYGYPYKNATGMVEVSGAKELVELLGGFAKGKRIGFLGEDTLTERKEVKNYEEKLGLTIVPAYASDFADWQQKYVDLQDKVDLLIVGNTAGMTDFDPKVAQAHALKHGKIPSGAIQQAPMDYAMIGYLKMPEEQGTWAAQTALEILDGTLPADIPLTRNKEGKLVINIKVAEAVGAELPYSLIESAAVVME